MNNGFIKTLKILVVVVGLLSLVTSCRDNKRRDPRIYGQYGTNYGYTGSGNDYLTGRNSAYSAWNTPSNPGYRGSGGSGTYPGGQYGQYGDYSNPYPGGTRGDGNISRRGASGGNYNEAYSQSPTATMTYPFVLEMRDSDWERKCPSPSSAGYVDEDGDGICKNEDRKDNAYNGFKVGAIKLAKGKRFSDLFEAVGDFNSETFYKVINDKFEKKALRVDAIGSIISDKKVGIIEMAGNWGTILDDKYTNPNVRLPSEEDAGARNSTKTKNILLKKSKNSGSFEGIDAISKDNSYMICHAGWFQKPENSSATSFKIQNAGSTADDGVFIFDEGKLKAYSVNEHESAITKNLWGKIFGTKKHNSTLEYTISNSEPHLLEFCFMNEQDAGFLRKDDIQGMVRMDVDIDDNKEYGYEPLNREYFTAVPPQPSAKMDEIDKASILGILKKDDRMKLRYANSSSSPSSNSSSSNNSSDPKSNSSDITEEGVFDTLESIISVYCNTDDISACVAEMDYLTLISFIKELDFGITLINANPDTWSQRNHDLVMEVIRGLLNRLSIEIENERIRTQEEIDALKELREDLLKKKSELGKYEIVSKPRR